MQLNSDSRIHCYHCGTGHSEPEIVTQGFVNDRPVWVAQCPNCGIAIINGDATRALDGYRMLQLLVMEGNKAFEAMPF